MPHAQDDSSNGVAMNSNASSHALVANGEQPHSKVLSHLDSYPVLHSTLEQCKAHPLGAKSLAMLHRTSATLLAPLRPYFKTPLSYLKPYLSRADDLGDASLARLDAAFPVVKEKPETLRRRAGHVARTPHRLVGDGKNYVVGAWNDEYRKVGGQPGVAKTVRAALSTELRIGADAYAVVLSLLRRGKDSAGHAKEAKLH